MELKLKKKLAGFIAAGVLALAMAPVAAFGVGALTADTTLTVTGLDEGDQVSFYQIIEQADAEHGNGWKFVDALDANGDGKLDGTNYTVEDFRAGANAEDYDDFEVIYTELANIVAVAVSESGATAAYEDAATAAGSIVIDLRDGLGADDPTPVGMYMAIVTTPAKTDVVYKPIFLSADYDQGDATGTVPAHDNTNQIDIVAEETDYQDATGVFKKSPLELVKEAGDEADRLMNMGVGDVVPFTITTNMPSYTQNFVSPVFKIKDVLTDGLALSDEAGTLLTADDTDKITVEVDGYTLELDKDYTVTITPDKQFLVEFANDADTSVDADEDGTADNDKDGILYTVLGNPKVTITYNAVVTDANAAAQVNQMDNTVRLDFTNNPDDETGAGTLKDRTRHYTFGIDANVMGNTTGPDGETVTSEIRKIAVDANGDPIYETATSETKETVEEEDPDVYHWLQDAEFKLMMTHAFKDADGDGYGDAGDFAQLDSPVEIKFDSNHIQVATGGSRPTSDANGYIAMKGLDAGIYELTEVSCPLGYSFDPTMKYVITIEPTYVDDNEADPTFTDVPNKILAGYTVSIDVVQGNTTKATSVTEYTSETAGTPATPVSFINEASEDDPTIENPTGGITTTDATSETAYIMNKELGILPATGGSGILFYVFIGAAIMALAVFLARRNRKDSAASATMA